MPALINWANTAHSYLLIGIPLTDRHRPTNAVVGLSPGTKQIYRYNKHHLVPFGELIPTGFRWFINLMQRPLGDFTCGLSYQVSLVMKDQKVLPNIGYEDVFGAEIIQMLQNEGNTPTSTILLNMSNIVWFANIIALPQDLQILQMVREKPANPALRATNTSATAIIDVQGRIQAMLPFETRETLVGNIQRYVGKHPYIRWGNGDFWYSPLTRFF